MIEVIRTRTIAAPCDDVWAVLAAFGDISAWASNADHSCLLNEPSTPGEPGDQEPMIGVARRIQAGRYVLVERITVWEPPHRLAYTIAGMPPVLKHVVNEWRLTRAGATDARTEVALVTHIDCGPRPPQQLIARIAGRRLAKASDTMLHGLDDWCIAAGRRPTTNEGTT